MSNNNLTRIHVVTKLSADASSQVYSINEPFSFGIDERFAVLF